MSEHGKATTDQELEIEATLSKLAGLLDSEYGVTDEFTRVITEAVNRHIELIDESRL